MEQRYYGTGHRKNAIARVWLKVGTGNITVNHKPAGEYLRRIALEQTIRLPLELTQTVDKYDIMALATGGGISGQAGAIRHGIAKALILLDENLRPVLRQAGMLTRDPRVKERKKYGRKRARRGFQFSKR